MKQFFLSALFAVAIATSAFSADPTKNLNKVSIRTLQTFSYEFGNISDVEWSLKDDFTKATFQHNNEKMEAFFDLRGDFLGTSKAVTLDQMPVNVKRVFAKRYADYTVKETIRFDGVDENAYYISAENEGRSIVLKISSNGNVSLYQSSKKN